jgi:hypothetical protein
MKTCLLQFSHALVSHLSSRSIFIERKRHISRDCDCNFVNCNNMIGAGVCACVLRTISILSKNNTTPISLQTCLRQLIKFFLSLSLAPASAVREIQWDTTARNERKNSVCPQFLCSFMRTSLSRKKRSSSERENENIINSSQRLDMLCQNRVTKFIIVSDETGELLGVDGEGARENLCEDRRL